MGVMRIAYQTETFKIIEAANSNLSEEDMELFIHRVNEMLKDFKPKGVR